MKDILTKGRIKSIELNRYNEAIRLLNKSLNKTGLMSDFNYKRDRDLLGEIRKSYNRTEKLIGDLKERIHLSE